MKRFWPAILWCVIIFYLCTAPANDLPSASWMQIIHLDKWIHSFLYFMLYSLLQSGISKTESSKIFNFWMIVSICLLYGIFIEWYQAHFTVNRAAEALDIVANTSGIIFGILFWKIYTKKWGWNI